jgi:hypothetical protein
MASCEVAVCPFSMADTPTVQVPIGSVLRMVYWPEYIPPAVFARAIVAPVGAFATTLAPETGAPLSVTRAAIVVVSPRLKTVFVAGAVMKTERPCEELVARLITCVPLPVFPCESEAETATN